MPSRRGADDSPSRDDNASVMQAEDVIGSAVRMRWRAANAKLVKEIPRNKESGMRATTGRLSAVMLELRSIFLPAGYPHSVRPDYLRFQCFDTLQAACSYLRSILTTSAILRGAGVGEESASPMAAAITWVLRDGVGMFGSLVFSYAVGAQFDVSVKEWRLFADLINDVGLTLDMCAPFGGPRGFVVIAALGAACKTICGMVAGATRASITAHFALQGNLADVSAKETAQETAVTLFGLIIGSAVAQRLGDSPLTAWLAFVILTSVHVWANVLGVGALVFDFLNPQRAFLVSRTWAVMGSWSSGGRWATSDERARALLSPEPTARQERFWRPLALWWAGPRLGVGVGDLIELSAPDGGAQQLREVHAVFAEEEYLLRLDPRGRPCVALRPSASGRTVLKALLHCATLDADGTFRRAGGNMRTAWRDKLRDKLSRNVYGPAAEASKYEGLLAAAPTAARPVGAAGGGLGAAERAALEESLAYCNEQWPAFSAALEGCGWKEAAVRIDHCCGAVRVRVQTHP